MRRRIKFKRPSHATIVAYLALFVAVGGTTAYAADTVFSSDIVDGEVKTPDVANFAVTAGKLGNASVGKVKIAGNAVDGPRVADGTLTEADLKNVPWQTVAANPPSDTDPCVGASPQTGVFCGGPAITAWSNYGGTFQTARFVRDAAGIVHVEGLVKSASRLAAAVFILPAGYRPANTLIFSVDCVEYQDNDPDSLVTHGRIDVQSDGAVYWPEQDNCDQFSAAGYISISGIDFKADQ